MEGENVAIEYRWASNQNKGSKLSQPSWCGEKLR